MSVGKKARKNQTGLTRKKGKGRDGERHSGKKGGEGAGGEESSHANLKPKKTHFRHQKDIRIEKEMKGRK